MATVALSLLVPPMQLATAGAPVYTSPTQTTAKIGRAVFTNTTGSAATITAGIVPAGGSLDDTTTLISAYSIDAGAAYVSPELAGLVIPSGSQLFAYAGTASAITCAVSGITIQ
jgi:hypothetical protein